MLMSFYSKNILGNDDTLLAEYVDDVEVKVGKAGIAEQIIQKVKWITGFSSLWWAVQQAGIEKWLLANSVKGKAVFVDGGTFPKLNEALIFGPVIVGTKKMGGLPGGHIILLTGFNGIDYIANDPFGNATTLYKNQNGESVVYPYEFLKKYTGEKPRYMYFERSV
jgi:hypothetical protein